jgi:hypothetical protein
MKFKTLERFFGLSKFPFCSGDEYIASGSSACHGRLEDIRGIGDIVYFAKVDVVLFLFLSNDMIQIPISAV